MLEFLCTTCGKRVQGDDSLTGQRVFCPACNMAMAAPQTGQTAASQTNAIAAAAPARLAKSVASDVSFREGAPAFHNIPSFSIRKDVLGALSRYTQLMIVA